MAQRWLPSLQQSTKMATTSAMAMIPRSYEYNIMLTSRSISVVSLPQTMTRGSAWMEISKKCMYPSLSAISPHVASILPLGRLKFLNDRIILAQQTREFATKKVGRLCCILNVFCKLRIFLHLQFIQLCYVPPNMLTISNSGSSSLSSTNASFGNRKASEVEPIAASELPSAVLKNHGNTPTEIARWRNENFGNCGSKGWMPVWDSTGCHIRNSYRCRIRVELFWIERFWVV